MWIPALHAMRGVAAFAVLVLHAYWTWPAAFSPVVRSLYLCVDLFFILSGFVICLRYGESFGQRTTVLAFMRKRFARLAPVYYVSGMFWLCAFTALYASRGEVSVLATLGAIGRYAFALDIFYTGDGPKLNPVAWSIMVEMYAYLLFALVFTAVRGRAARIALACAIIAGGGAWMALHTPDLNLVAGPESALRCFVGFFTGVLICQVNELGAKRGLLALGAALVLAILGIAAAGLGVDHIVFCVLALGMVLLVAFHRALPAIPRFFMFLGDVSFSLYLWHFVISVMIAKLLARLSSEGEAVMHLGERFVAIPALHGVLGLTTYAAVSVGVAYLSYRALEQRDLFKRRGASAVAAQVE